MAEAQKKRSRRRKKEQPIIVEPPKSLDYPNFSFDIEATDPNSRARVGKLKTPHGTIETPNYIFCGTKASIKNLSIPAVREARTDIILGNTYHLLIQPGTELIEKMGGLHNFMQWDGPMMTDSGGYQIFSMGHGSVADELKGRNKDKGREKSLLKITEEGATFKSYWDGSTIHLTPELAIEHQRRLGADLIYQFDECTPYHVDRSYTENALRRNYRWADRCLKEFERTDSGKQALYGIVSGGVYEDLRKESCEYVSSRPFFGTAIGDCLGGTYAEFKEIVSWCTPALPEDRPIHLLGIGRIRDIFECVPLGIDTFDCVSPTRIARHGWALERGNTEERINLRNAKFRDDPEPLDPSLDVPASRDYSKAYIHHLIKAGEMLGMQLIAQHNIAVINRLMREVREAIRTGTLKELEKEWLPE
ncbi:MAG TPA: tRNA guanosine(34) transglycosylase Tgt [Micavibrio sp.]|nr:tRNA guanosine(34) transglycosylase Tgt [Micavibrio sp.]